MVDVNTPVTNPELVVAIKEVQENSTPETQDNLINEVMKAHFIAPVNISPVPGPSDETGSVTLNEKTTISFNIIENTANQQFFLAFTDWEELGKWHKSEKQQTLILTFDDLAAMVLDEKGNSDGFVINPYGGNIVFNRGLVKALRDEKERRANGGVVEHEVKKDTSVQLGQPRVYPQELVNAISDHLKKQKNVQAAYLQLMVKDGEQSYLVVVDFTGDRRALFDGIAKVAMPHLNGMFIDLVPMNSDFGLNATRSVEPFYKKKRFGLF